MHAMHLSRIALTVVSFCSIVTPATPQSRLSSAFGRLERAPRVGLGRASPQAMCKPSRSMFRAAIVAKSWSRAGGGVYPLRGKGGTIIDAGVYSFSPPGPNSISARELRHLLGRMRALSAARPDAGALPFRFIGRDRAQFIGLIWTKVQ